MTDNDELAERLTRFYREVRTEIPSVPPAWTPPNRRTLRWLKPVLASAALVVVAVSLGIGLRMVREHANLAQVTASPTVKSSPQVTPTPTPSPAPTANWVTQRFSIGSVTSMAIDPSAVFAIYAPAPVYGHPVPTKLARIDRTSGAVITADVSAGAMQMVRVNGGLWIASGPGIAPAPTNVQWLTLVDPATLRVKRQVHLPGQPGTDVNVGPQLAGSANFLWLGYGNRVYRLNPDTGGTLLSQSLPGPATSLSIDPSGHRLYVGVDSSANGNGTALVMELDSSTGVQLASAPTGGGGLGGPHVAASADGVWVSYATGMMGAVEHRSATSLATLAIAGLNPPESAYHGTNGITAIVGDGTLWLLDGGIQLLRCADPAGGAIDASAQETFPSAFVADGTGAYLGDGDGVATLNPDPSCRH